MGLLSRVKLEAVQAVVPDVIEAPPVYRELPQYTTHCGQPAELIETDEDGGGWYRTVRAYRGGLVVCFVRDTFLDTEVPFET